MRDDIDTIPIVNEQLLVEKRQVLDGTVEVRTFTELVDESFEMNLDRTEISVKRIPFDVFVDVAPSIRTEGDVTILPVLEERLVVQKRLVLVEEVHIRRTTMTTNERVDAVLRKQRATVERNQNPTTEEK
jgi:uncharacterized protein (TIGR02271 family)